MYDPDYQYGYNPPPSSSIPKGKHRIENICNNFMLIRENNPTCNWAYKYTIISKSQYNKKYNKKDCINKE